MISERLYIDYFAQVEQVIIKYKARLQSLFF